MQSWKWRRMLKLMHSPLSIMVNRYSWNLRCERKLWHRKVTFHHCLLKFTVERAKFWHIREKRRILRKYWILKTNYIYKFPCSSVLSVVCTVKIEFSSELISQIRGVILYLADSEHWTRSRFRPVSSDPEMGPFIKCGGGGVLQPMITPPVLLSSCSLLLDHLSHPHCS